MSQNCLPFSSVLSSLYDKGTGISGIDLSFVGALSVYFWPISTCRHRQLWVDCVEKVGHGLRS